jgi:hypothetical protein
MRYIDQRRDYIQFCFARHPIAKTEAFRVVIGAEASGINPVAGYKKTPRMKIGDKEQEIRSAQAHLQEANERLKAATIEYNEKKKVEHETQRAVNAANNRRKENKNKIMRQDDEIEAAQQALDDAQLESKVTEYEEMLKVCSLSS